MQSLYNLMLKVEKQLECIEKFGIFICTAGLCILMTLVIVFRYVLNSPLLWSDELLRFLFLWGIYLGIPYLYIKNELTKVDYFYNKMPLKLKKVVNIINQLLILIFLIIMLPATIEVAKTYTRPMPSLHIKGYYLFLSCTIGIGLMLVHHVISLIRIFFKKYTNIQI